MEKTYTYLRDLRIRDKLFLAVFMFISICMLAAGWFFWGEQSLAVIISLMIAVLLTVQIFYYRRNQRRVQEMHEDLYNQNNNHYRQIESMFSIFSVLKINRPLPPMGVWSVEPDFLSHLTTLILSERPALILEASSGVSTLVSSYCLKKLGLGSIVSLEHEEGYARKCQRAIREHELEDIATVLHAPLKEHEIKGKSWMWYDTSQIEKIGVIDMMIVDGPPRNIQRQSRYPAVPLLIEKMKEHALLILDDGRQDDIKEMAAMWQDEFQCFECETIKSKNEIIVLRKIAKK
ncbi:class I SAM-dependent methyltransferase [Fibrobacterota bacterium]